ncbi:MAG: phospho-N-acetylmuramoyl-pentapeptide-transferase [Candidatus Obscuribacter phosphatis]|uniref:Phospho-N-acetylmuramoyl-pentapeptide-transferase n=1 Tax=Candidatus Obscuribacter phosphatis TaxID=1906157 RepID=A0A8J7PFF0_9BACT|nr:phospho-N-acetylmuramoyl-pentapeptide-transferase [Candidatus Obscuribacter phosphatis]
MKAVSEISGLTQSCGLNLAAVPECAYAMMPAPVAIFLPAFCSMALTAAILPFYIKRLKDLQINQFLREEGPKSHAHKAKTPTMGGLTFIFATTAVCLAVSFFKPLSLTAIAVVITGALCGVVGVLDDSAKVINKANKGIPGQLRLLIETILGALLAFIIAWQGHGALVLPEFLLQSFPALASHTGTPFGFVALPLLLLVPLGAFLAAATTNAVNLHDGMDGLAAGTSCQVFALLSVLLYETGQSELATIAATAAGALLGFLFFNKNPAKIFMGDTGSLFIGGLMSCLVLAGGLLIWFVPLAAIYIAETLSVMIQVVYFKLTKPYTPEKAMSKLALIKLKLTKKLPGEGKRLFRMAPLHHHYEAVYSEKGVSEWQVVAAFWAVQFLLCLIVLVGFEWLRASLPCSVFRLE